MACGSGVGGGEEVVVVNDGEDWDRRGPGGKSRDFVVHERTLSRRLAGSAGVEGGVFAAARTSN